MFIFGWTIHLRCCTLEGITYLLHVQNVQFHSAETLSLYTAVAYESRHVRLHATFFYYQQQSKQNINYTSSSVLL